MNLPQRRRDAEQKIPKGFHHSAWGCLMKSGYAGWADKNEINPEWVESIRAGRRGNPFRVETFAGRFPSVAAPRLSGSDLQRWAE